MIWSSYQLSEALDIELLHDITTGSIQFNSKDVKPGDLFIALQGNTDGHLYVQDAINNGASAVVIDKPVACIPAQQVIYVSDTMIALKKLAYYKRQQSIAQFIAISGSVGKTTTKESLKLMLSTQSKVFASRANFNNALGMLINLASMPNDAEYCIFELAMNHAGEILNLSKIIKPHIAVITALAPVHLQFFNSVYDIVDAKCEIFEGIQQNGNVVLNLDNEYRDQLLLNLQRFPNLKVHTFGSSKHDNARLKSYEMLGNKSYLTYVIGDEKIAYSTFDIPKHYAQNFAAALMVVNILGLDLNKALKAMSSFRLIEGRGNIVELIDKNKQKYQLICDYYNAAPLSMHAALINLANINHKKKMIIIGDMLELGSASEQLHKDLVPYIVSSNAITVLLVGAHVKHIYDLLPNSMTKSCFPNVDELLDKLGSFVTGNEIILIKGSHSIGLEKILDHFKTSAQ